MEKFGITDFGGSLLWNDLGHWHTGGQIKNGRQGSVCSVFIVCIYREDDFLKKRLQKGSFTVEASMLLPFLIFIIFAFFCLCLNLQARKGIGVMASGAGGGIGKGKTSLPARFESFCESYSENSHGELYRQYQSFGRLESERRRTGGSLKPHSKASKSPGNKKDRGKGGVI